MSDIEMKKRKLLLSNFQSGVTAFDSAIQIANQYNCRGFSIRSCHLWYKKFREGDFDLNIKPMHYRKWKHIPVNQSTAVPENHPNISKDGLMQFRFQVKKKKTPAQTDGGEALPKEDDNDSAIIYTKPSIVLTKRSNQQSAELNIKLPPKVANRMPLLPTKTVTQSITSGNQITAPFKNTNPNSGSNTVKQIAIPTADNSNKKSTTPLAARKGVIYLNREIALERTSLPNTPNSKPVTRSSFPMPIALFTSSSHQSMLPAPIEVEDSDSDDDLVFPSDVPIPQPKLKPLFKTFATFWDMETGDPISLNEPLNPSPQSSVIEID